MTRSFALLPLTALLLAFAARPATADDRVAPVYSQGGHAIQGYDPVAYFEQQRAVRGKEDFSFDWMGATWLFSSAENRDRFAAAPEDYAPQYGGYCAYAVSEGHTAKSDPDAFKILDGKLYLNYNRAIQQRWLSDTAQRIQKANKNWPRLHK